MGRKERRTFFRHIYIAAVGIISLPKLWESVWGCDEAPGSLSSFHRLEHIWVTHQRERWGFWQSPSQPLWVCMKTQLGNQAPPTPSPRWWKTPPIWDESIVHFARRAKDQECIYVCSVFCFSQVGDLFIFMSGLSLSHRGSHRANWAKKRKETKVFDWFRLNQVSFLVLCKLPLSAADTSTPLKYNNVRKNNVNHLPLWS